MAQIFAPGSIAGPQGPPTTFSGAYDPATPYAIGQAVSSGGSSYVSLVAGNVGNTPASSPTQWGLLAAGGATGAAGSQGSVTALASAVLPLLNGNLFDVNKVAVGYYVNSGGGFSGGPGVDDRWSSTGLIYCPGATSMISNLPITLVYGVPFFALYDANGNFIGSLSASDFGASYSGNVMLPNTAFALPGNQVYVRFSYASNPAAFGFYGYPTDATIGMIYASTGTAVLPGSFQPSGVATVADVNTKFAASVVTAGNFASNIGSHILPLIGNLFDIGKFADGYGVSANGTLVADSRFASSPLIFCPGATSMIANVPISFMYAVLNFALYDASGTFIGTEPASYFGVTTDPLSAVPPNVAFSLPGTQSYVRFSWPSPEGARSGLASVLWGSGGYPANETTGMVFASTTTATLPGGFAPFGSITPPSTTIGVIRETRTLRVEAHKADGLGRVFTSPTGPGNVERIEVGMQYNNSGASTLAGPNTTITITVDGNTYTAPLSLFLLWYGFTTTDMIDAPGTALFSTDTFAVLAGESGEGYAAMNGGFRKIYIKWNTSCTIDIATPSGYPGTLYTQTEYYSGTAPVGRYPATRNVFHMVTNPLAAIAPGGGINLLPAITGAGELESIFFATSVAGSGAITWLENAPRLYIDGTSFLYGGGEDFFGNMFYGSQAPMRNSQYGIGRFYVSAAPDNRTYWTGYRYFTDSPIVFGASLSAAWQNWGSNPGAADTVGSVAVYYTTV